MNIKRNTYIHKIVEALTSDKLVLLTGPRQVGKTTLMYQVAEHIDLPSVYINIEDRYGEQRSTKQVFVSRLKTNHGFDVYASGLLMLDEVQYFSLPDALLKSLYDDVDIQCYILATGSRFRGQTRVGSSLVGRGAMIRVWSFSFAEFLQAKGLHSDDIQEYTYLSIAPYIQEYLIYGGYPAVVLAQTVQQKKDIMESIVGRYIERDFQTYIGNKANDILEFRQMLQYVTRSIGSIWKARKVAQQAHISSYMVEKYLGFLVDSYLVGYVYPLFKDSTKEYNAHKEVFFHDHGLINYFSRLRESHEQQGKLIENCVYTHLSRNDAIYTLSYRKSKTQTEIDFVCRMHDGKLIPVEVKSADQKPIPKAFHSIYKTYVDEIDYFVLTTKSVKEQAQSRDALFEIAMMPRWQLDIL